MNREILDKTIKSMPHEPPFLFVDNIIHLDDMKIEGEYTLRKDEYFYQGHFPDKPDRLLSTN